MIARGTRATVGAAVASVMLLLGAQDGTAAHRAARSPRRVHASSGHGRRPRTTAPPVALFNREPFPYSANVPTSTEAKRYAVMVLQGTDGAKVRQLHRANPHLKILVDQDGLLEQIGDTHQFDSCTNYDVDVYQHPDRFLRTRYGGLIPSKNYHGYVLMDIGNPAYVQACIAHAIALAKRWGFNGIFLDDVTAWVGWGLPASFLPIETEYRTVSGWDAAMQSYISYARSQAHAHGLLVFGNIGGSTEVPGLWQRWSRILDGSEEQSWTDAGLGLDDQIYDWPAKLANVAWSEAHRKYVLLHSYNTTAAGNEYGLASVLLVANGWSSYSTSNANFAAPEVWRAVYVTAQHLGPPAGRYRRLSSGVYERKFAHGMVVVNPTARPVPGVSLGASYRGSGGGKVRSVTMNPTTGEILLAAS